MSVKSFDILKSLFLLLLGVSSNFVAETLGCKTQKIFSENMFAKQGIILMILYFTLTFVSGSTTIHPGNNLLFTLFIWIMYLLFTKMNIEFTLLTIALFAINYVTYTYITYYKNNPTKHSETINRLEYTYNLINKFLIVFVIIGFILYFKKQYSDHSGDWSTSKFLFGKVQCDSMK